MANYNTYRIYNRKTNDLFIPKYGTKQVVVTERILDTKEGTVEYKEVAKDIKDMQGYWHIPGSHPDANQPSRYLEIEGKEEYDKFMSSDEVRNLVRLKYISTEKVG